jgi:sulfatase modifying factor 1
MNDEATFLQAMQEHPEDTALRLVFADWLEERGDPRGELVRLLHTLTQSVEVPDRSKLEDRLRNLLASGVHPVGPFWTNSIGMKFAWIPAGTFLMGSPEDEEERVNDETQHKITLSKGFFLAIHPVTQASWQEIMGNNPSGYKYNEHPVEQVSWDDSQEFLRKLSDQDGHSYRLPTEAEWEYACRGGTTTPFYFGETISIQQAAIDQGWSETDKVGRFPPNAWGLYDMHGNVWEWCADWYGDYPQGEVVDPQGPEKGEERILRGGSFWNSIWHARSASRSKDVPTFRDGLMSLRPVRTYP